MQSFLSALYNKICVLFHFQVRDCRTEPVLHTSLVLTWTGYDDINGGVERMVPSHCSQHVCPPGYTGPECDQLTVDKVS